MVDNNMQVIENVFNDYCFYSELYEINRVIKKESFDKVSSSIYENLRNKMDDKDIYKFFDYFIKSILVDQINGIKIDNKYLTGRVSSIDEEIEKANDSVNNTNKVPVLKAKVKRLDINK